jgi:WD40 repeat protein
MNAAATPTTRPLKLTSTSQTLPHGHLDYVLDISFDHYGRRFATASGDRTVRVWDLNADGLWANGASVLPAGAGAGGNNNNIGNGQSNVNEWQAHRGPVNRISWAHPEFGQLLATAGAGEWKWIS